MEKTKANAKRIVIISLILYAISMIGASLIQTSSGEVEIKDLSWETSRGHTMSALLYIPEDVSDVNEAPAIVTSHGWYNNREMQDLNAIEYSRRGYVVMSIDMYGHGNSEAVSPEEWEEQGTGMYDAVELVDSFDYVDSSRIGVTGHSNGGRAANYSVEVDNEKDNPLISSVLLIAHDAEYKDQNGEYFNEYGNRDVGIVAGKYDEFFFRTMDDDENVTPPKDFINSEKAQSFLNFGASPKEFNEKRSSYNMYEQKIDGEEAERVIFNPAQTHPWNHFSATVVDSSLGFFDETLGTPDTTPGHNQIWQWKVLFNFIGLVGFIMFLVSFTKLLLFTSPFKSLRLNEKTQPKQIATSKERMWFWISLALSAFVSGASYILLYDWAMEVRPDFFPQSQTFFIAIWAAINGLFTIVIMTITRVFTPNKNKLTLKDLGVTIKPKALLKTIALALIVSFSAYALVFFSDYFFKTDFRTWVVAVKAFTPDKLLVALKYLPFLSLFFIANSVAVNCFNYFGNSKKEWINTAIVALFNVLGVLVVFAINYSILFTSGLQFFGDFSVDSVNVVRQNGLLGVWLIPLLFILPGAAIISRKIFRITMNPYLGGIIVTIIVTLITVTNTLTQV
ncbi:alpha/beta fold hydrolase [Tetragenococcus halophilus]|uniref:acetylxylan esterase n=1 Tax=Tetragenococcus halophilus TaxID=51669 RepID=UPI00255EDB65|nr:acetylxylan esterase [Tetragenococcus halophilus]GMG64569.1 alpha/beta fold hydrolase [Tetragenococcus halophilus]